MESLPQGHRDGEGLSRDLGHYPSAFYAIFKVENLRISFS